MPGFHNGIMFADNVDFSGGITPTAQITSNGQLLIGSTSLPNIQPGVITSPDGSVTIGYSAPNITLQVTGGSTSVETLTPDSGLPVPPVGGTIPVLGETANSIPVMQTYNDGFGNFRVADQSWITKYVVDQNTTVGLKGTFSTIQSAINAAQAEGTLVYKIIYIRPGNYTENLTISSNKICLMGLVENGFLDGATLSNLDVVINGTLTVTGNSRYEFQNIRIFTNTAAVTTITINNASANVNFVQCFISANAAGTPVSSTCSNLLFSNCTIQGGNITLTSTTSTNFGLCTLYSGITASSSPVGMFLCSIVGTTNSTTGGAAAFNMTKCYESGGGSTFTVNAGNAMNVSEYNNLGPSGDTFTGAGTLTFGDLNGLYTVSTTVQIPLKSSTFNCIPTKSPGGYPYTTTPSDGVVLVNSSSARTINLNASPVTGQQYVIKDDTGSAGTNNITITPAAGNIDGSANALITTNYGSKTLVYDGSKWVTTNSESSQSGSGFPWTVITAGSQAMSSNNGYIANNAGTIAFTLPTVSAVGDTIAVTGINNATGWSIAYTTNQQIFFGTSTSTLTSGSISSTNTRDTVTLVCVTANLTWNVINSIGNITVA